ncbi:hypothetical protein L2E82_07460 [Cichorium intybus]|uniref:Uncharacterized protein n=1 Tax=Cichorium intybus TaxID=13427 RepID=A0ACB9G4E9_CICIN|nr:hypothetical protein L2E82_07460 [Cichorium intybus]
MFSETDQGRKKETVIDANEIESAKKEEYLIEIEWRALALLHLIEENEDDDEQRLLLLIEEDGDDDEQ